MQLTEIKNDLATISYSPEINKLMLSDFILIEDANQSILSQIISIEATMEEDVNAAMLKFLLSIDKDANLTQYSGYVPAKSAELILINPEEVIQLIRGNDKNVYLGNLALYPNIPIELNLDFLRKRPYIQVDFVENKLHIVKSILDGLEKNGKKIILIDFNGMYESLSLPTVMLGYNFKLPLNYEALCYIAEEELNDCNNDNKAVIQGILIEVQNYVKSTEDEFIPFNTLISVLDAQYNETPMPELLLLKNKLLKYQQQDIFAQEKSEFDFLDTFLKDAKNFKFDLSKLPSQWNRIAFASILDIIKTKCYLITEFNDENSNKSIIRKLYDKNEVKPIVISSYNYKYQLQLKAVSKNMVLFKPITKVNDFAGYTSFLNILSQDTFIVWGEQTLFIPLILKLQNENTFSKINKKVSQISLNVAADEIIPLEEQTKTDLEQHTEYMVKGLELTENAIDIEDSSFLNTVEPKIETESAEIMSRKELSESKIDLIPNEEFDTDSEIGETEALIEQEMLAEEEFSISENEPEISQQEEPDDAFNDDYNEITEDELNHDGEAEDEFDPEMETEDLESDAEFYPEDIHALTEDEENFEPVQNGENDIPNEDDLDFFFNEEENNIEIEPQDEIVEETQASDEIDNDEQVEDFEDVIVDENLNIHNNGSEEKIIKNIEELENEEESNKPKPIEELAQKDTKEETAKGEKTGSVPVYSSNVAPQFNTKFAQGTYVYHPKYGRGVVERVTKCGAKELCMIIFDKVGRRFLDPTIADLKQV